MTSATVSRLKYLKNFPHLLCVCMCESVYIFPFSRADCLLPMPDSFFLVSFVSHVRFVFDFLVQ